MLIFPFYWLLARRILGPAWGALAVVAVSLDWNQWTIFVTGVVPVLGFGGICLALWAMLGIADKEKPPGAYKPGGSLMARRPNRDLLNVHHLALILSIPLIAYSNQTSAGLALVSLTVAWLALPGKRGVGMYLAIGGLLAIAVAFPWYAAVLPGSDKVAAPGPLFYLPPAYQWQWYQAVIVAGAVYASIRLIRARKVEPNGLRVLLALVVTHTALSLVWSNDEALMNILFRSAIWVTVPFWIVLVWLVSRWQLKTVPLTITIGAMLTLAAIGAGWIYQDQFQYSEHMSADVVAAVKALDLDTVTRIGTNGESRAYWLSAYTGKPVVWVQPARPAPAYKDAERQARCELGWIDNCATGYVSHWIVDKTVRQQVPVAMTVAPEPLDPWGTIHAPWLARSWSKGNVEVWQSVLK